MLRFTLAAALFATVAAPAAAHATGGCWPHVSEKTYSVAGQDVQAIDVQIVC